ncbi:MAG: hypothetical protein IPP29_06860 [Bacteroidetes bacterium]|nr:hypothetical protein [Bacteroidota bacterium]
MLEKEIMNGNPNEKTFEVKTEKIKTGIYFLKLSTSREIKIIKFVKL